MNIKSIITIENHQFTVDLNKPEDISICLIPGAGQLKAWYVPDAEMLPVRDGNWVGEVKQGASVNFRNIFFNPHGHTTHTECVGHISREDYHISDVVKNYFFHCQLISVTPELTGEDLVIGKKQFTGIKIASGVKALVVRTLPNDKGKMHFNYCHTNPAYFDPSAIAYFIDHGIEHLLTDLPSVDKEKDNGVLAAHHLFWNYPDAPALERTITELVYVDNRISDGLYLLNLLVSNFRNDAAPSRPILYKYDE